MGFMETHLVALNPYEPSVGFHRLSEKVEDDVWLRPKMSWWRLATYFVLYLLSCGALGYAPLTLFPSRMVVFMQTLFLVLRALPLIVALLFWCRPAYHLPTALASQLKMSRLGYRGELKTQFMWGNNIAVNRNKTQNKREEEADFLAVAMIPRDRELLPRRWSRWMFGGWHSADSQQRQHRQQRGHGHRFLGTGHVGW